MFVYAPVCVHAHTRARMWEDWGLPVSVGACGGMYLCVFMPLYVCMHACVHTCESVYAQRSEDNLEKMVLSFCYVGSGD